MRNHGAFVMNENWVLAAGEYTGCWTGENT